ncbi:MAG: hypothetical protein A2289_21700 [Deltaproteobacteria bacterium RIFOXYA12_FULL_58_15]|nr:MAG: hypothetical protein A2289_21700 [Deltaproteobacteria bacterium RIFOXYA12_FULL_58_15]OGR09528.1 MAG: hypothetical protein A2341_16575 [Deltaproteobacteria bacterium RIFOXYB12_FULL_58_9]
MVDKSFPDVPQALRFEQDDQGVFAKEDVGGRVEEPPSQSPRMCVLESCWLVRSPLASRPRPGGPAAPWPEMGK